VSDPAFSSRDELSAWARQRLRYPDPSPDAKLKALADIRRVTLAHAHLLEHPTPIDDPRA
jgi:hypothetical protein